MKPNAPPMSREETLEYLAGLPEWTPMFIIALHSETKVESWRLQCETPDLKDLMNHAITWVLNNDLKETSH